jgi:hypothetical protein
MVQRQLLQCLRVSLIADRQDDAAPMEAGHAALTISVAPNTGTAAMNSNFAAILWDANQTLGDAAMRRQ